MNHAAIARTMGCDGIRVDRPAGLAQALTSALAGGRPAAIDVVTFLKEAFRKVTSPLAAPAAPWAR